MNFDKEKYELVKQERIEELKSDAYLFRHKKSGARVALMSNDDENKVFYIGFRTPPKDSTGVPHIMEHSVLCGSEKYPVKDPFIELIKGSLNTFLNAMTYPDKTVYPVASCNDVDFKNLMDVYMDAVFHPDIYRHKEIFMQEGWHYELESPDSPLIYNGVVFNEMKGAFSSPDDVMARYCLNSLYPDTSYSVESGGDPACIPDLTYKNFLNFHRKFYHPANSYIYIYGNCDMSERLEYLDREYLSHYDEISVDSEIPSQKPFDGMKRVETKYSVTEDEGTEDKTYLAYNLSIGDSLDKELSLAMQVIDYALFSAPGAPVKQALIKAGIGDEITCSYEAELKQPMYTIAAKNTDVSREKEFLDIINSTVKDIVEKGINRRTLTAAINSMEFRYREADFGRFPKGLMYGLSVMGTWLYDENKPFINLARNETFEFLKKNIDTGYFEDLVKKYFLENPHTSLVVLKPAVNLTAENEKKTAEKLASYKASLSAEEIERIVKETKELKEYQSEPSSDEDLRKIPLLKREDISRDILPLCNEISEKDGVRIDFHDIYTNGIGYLQLAFDISSVPDEDISYASLLGQVLGLIDTDSHTFEELSDECDIHTGGISFGLDAYNVTDGTVKALFSANCRALAGEYPKAMELIREAMFESHFDDHVRLKEILAETKSRMQAMLVSAGNAYALRAAESQISEKGRYTELTSGISFYDFIAGLCDNFDEKKDVITEKLGEVAGEIFTKDKLIVSVTGDKQVYGIIKPVIDSFIDGLPEGGKKACIRNFAFSKKNVGFKTAAQVNYVVRCGNFAKAGFEYRHELRLLKKILDNDYLWNNIRVKGGAYGCGNGYTSAGIGYFGSYRDPNLAATDRIYKEAVDYISSFDADEREMTKYIIGTFSDIDMPLTAADKGRRSFVAYIIGRTEDFIREERKSIINAQPEDVRKLAPLVKSVIDSGCLAVIGNEDKIEKDRELFDEVRNLF